ncbi:GspE/PulE family protein [Clostridium sp.]|uniref:GspE/PulE family protein n=1 Tax=Clostridium sp. TaxID=1506 RepID=UPI002638BE69|nr:GspE/PulE family protein [Clostridium sp.]
MSNKFKLNKIDIDLIDLQIARKIGKEKALEGGCLPIYKGNKELFVISKNESIEELKEIKFIYGLNIKVINISEDLLDSIINYVYLGEEEGLFEILLKDSIKKNASDIHFEPEEEDTLIRVRIDGSLNKMTKIYKSEYIKLISKVKALGNMDITERRRPQDGKVNIKLDNRTYDLRISTIPTINGEKLVIRILYGERFNYNMNSLNINKKQEDKIKRIIGYKTGLVIVAGPTGSGKSSSLYTILKNIKDKDINITTLEDPVEVVIKGINQMNLNPRADITFAKGLRSILRQDPDVIMVGEIRDEETANIAIRASLTGHKVYTTIHTKSPEEVIYRLEDMGVKSYLIKDSIVGIISQRLIRVLCAKCKMVNNEIYFNNKKIKDYNKAGCELCNYTGYKGRKILSSIVEINKISIGNKENIFYEVEKEGNKEMIDNLNELLLEGEIGLKEYQDFIIEEGFDYDKYFKNIKKG